MKKQIEKQERNWIIGDIHPVYGECQMMGVTGGEAYRWFVKDWVVSMIPLSMLERKKSYAQPEIRSY